MIKKLIKQFMKFFSVGVISTICDYITFVLLSFFDIFYIVATISGNVVGAIINFTLNKKITFKNKTKNLKNQIIKYSISVIIYMVSTTSIMYIAVDILSLNKYISRIFITGIMFIFNFIINKLFVFSEGI